MTPSIHLDNGILILPSPVVAALRQVGARTLVDVVVWLQSWAAFPSAMPRQMTGQAIAAILRDVTVVLRGIVPDSVLYPSSHAPVAFGALIPQR